VSGCVYGVCVGGLSGCMYGMCVCVCVGCHSESGSLENLRVS